MREIVLLALALPLVSGTATMMIGRTEVIKVINGISGMLVSAILGIIVWKVAVYGAFSSGWVYVDALSALLLLVVSILTATSTLYSLSYMDRELAEGRVKPTAIRRYYGLFQLFIFTMIGMLVAENLGIIWIGVEATTLASTLLVAFYFNRSALEAAWKYVMVCTVGILFALLGMILLYYAQVNITGTGVEALNWLVLNSVSAQLNPELVKLAAVFILIGYGTKAGLAPMHTWLPDAYSQAPAPVSGLMSGALLSCAFYALIRSLIVVEGCLDTGFVHTTLVSLGVFSAAVAVPFILIQHDVKRLLAYSSVEHAGIIAFGLGIGTPLALYGVMQHIINHAVTKSVLFYLAGTVVQQYRTKQIMRIRGLLTTMPGTGAMFLVAILAIAGTPPMNVFFSKFAIIRAAFESGDGILGSIMLLLLAGVFVGMLFYGTKMLFGTGPAHFSPVPIGAPRRIAIIASILWIIGTGVYTPWWLHRLLMQATDIVAGRG